MVDKLQNISHETEHRNELAQKLITKVDALLGPSTDYYFDRIEHGSFIRTKHITANDFNIVLEIKYIGKKSNVSTTKGKKTIILPEDRSIRSVKITYEKKTKGEQGEPDSKHEKMITIDNEYSDILETTRNDNEYRKLAKNITAFFRGVLRADHYGKNVETKMTANETFSRKTAQNMDIPGLPRQYITPWDDYRSNDLSTTDIESILKEIETSSTEQKS